MSDNQGVIDESPVSETLRIAADLVITRVAPQVIVESAPKHTSIRLEVIQGADEHLMLVSDGCLYLGNDRAGNEVIYRVTGWDDKAGALLLERED